MTYVVTLRSELGGEEFEYESLKEALAGIGRIQEKAWKLKDSIDRSFSIDKKRG